MSALVILILVWFPAEQNTPVITHRVFDNREVCVTRMQSLKAAFDQMENHRWMMACEPMHEPEDKGGQGGKGGQPGRSEPEPTSILS
jgi:hypothetical protein